MWCWNSCRVGSALSFPVSFSSNSKKKRSPIWGPRNLHMECAHPNGWRDKYIRSDVQTYTTQPHIQTYRTWHTQPKLHNSPSLARHLQAKPTAYALFVTFTQGSLFHGLQFSLRPLHDNVKSNAHPSKVGRHWISIWPTMPGTVSIPRLLGSLNKLSWRHYFIQTF